MMPTPSQIEELAVTELRDEQLQEAIAAAKARIRAKIAAGRWWHRFVPFTVKIERRA